MVSQVTLSRSAVIHEKSRIPRTGERAGTSVSKPEVPPNALRSLALKRPVRELSAFFSCLVRWKVARRLFTICVGLPFET